MTLRLAPSFLALRPGQLVAIADVAGIYRVEGVTLDGLVVVIEARRVPHGTSALVADPGRGNLDPDLATGHSIPLLLDLPASGDVGADQFGETVAIGSDGRFRPTAVTLEANGQPLASLRVDRAAVTGIATSPLGPGAATVIDRINSVDVTLSNPAGLLYHADVDALAMGANAMLVGDEWIQFGRAESLGEGNYRLSELLRGRRGSEWAMDMHASGEAVVLLDPESLTRIAMDRAMLGAEVVARAYGIADDEADPPSDVMPAAGESLRPLSPGHLEVVASATHYAVRWVARRSSLIGWPGGSDDVLSATFAVTAARGGPSLSRTTTATELAFTTAEIAALGSGPIHFEVVEQGGVSSRPALLTLIA